MMWYNRVAPSEDRAMLGSNLSAARCAGWRQPYLDTMMPERDAVAGIIVCGVKLLSGVAFWPQCAKPMQRHCFRRQGYCHGALSTHCWRHWFGLSIHCCFHCIRHCRRHCRRHCQCQQYSSGKRGLALSAAVGRWGGILSSIVGTYRTIVLQFAQHFKTKKSGECIRS